MKGYSKIYTYKKLNIDKVWQVYSSDNWEKDEIIEKKLEKAKKVDEDIWILELEDKEGNYPSF